MGHLSSAGAARWHVFVGAVIVVPVQLEELQQGHVLERVTLLLAATTMTRRTSNATSAFTIARNVAASPRVPTPVYEIEEISFKEEYKWRL